MQAPLVHPRPMLSAAHALPAWLVPRTSLVHVLAPPTGSAILALLVWQGAHTKPVHVTSPPMLFAQHAQSALWVHMQASLVRQLQTLSVQYALLDNIAVPLD